MANEVDKTFAVIAKLKEVELELHRLKNALEMMNRATLHIPTSDEPESLLNSVHCQCGASWTFKDGALNYKPSKQRKEKSDG
jgi:predicted metal-dependent hydrolase